ncbi:MAG: MFS transporter [bacterium]|nr:MFS transporter [bacterium]MDD5757032.1 MFS transporter [bacterium]
MKKYFTSLKHRDFRLFWAGQMVSLTGTWMQNVAQGWLVLQLTNSPFLLGVINAIAAFPILLFSVWGGTMADRMGKRNLIIWTQALSMILAFIMGLLFSLRIIEFWHIALLAGLIGLVNAFDMPARHSFVIEMVGKADLGNAIALNSMIFNVARIIGPIVAGFVVGVWGVGTCFYINSASFLAVLAGLLLMRGDFAPKKSNHSSLHESTMDGARYVWSNLKIRNLISLVAVSSLFGVSYMVLMPVFARDILNIGASGLGILVSAIGVGALLASFSLTIFSHQDYSNRLVSLGGIVLGISLVIFGFSKSVPVSLLALVGTGWGIVTQSATINNLLQKETPDELRGRVMGFYTVMFLGMTPLGSFLAGLLADWLTVPYAVVIGGLTALVMTILLSRAIFKTHPDQANLILDNKNL